ncbi:hypothetical protein, partial [Arthrobacter globiformis]|uniref:hypothetical protein n=1 Tax=Arthrobacter globiformis TaxID=1665 RepID=UPI001C0EBC89
ITGAIDPDKARNLRDPDGSTFGAAPGPRPGHRCRPVDDCAEETVLARKRLGPARGEYGE